MLSSALKRGELRGSLHPGGENGHGFVTWRPGG